MSESKLTSKQQCWLEHIQEAERQGQSLSDYAQQHSLNLKLLYNMKHALRQKGLLAKPAAKQSLLPVQLISQSSRTLSSCRISLPNGVVIELPGDWDAKELDRLLQSASQLT